jgi:hypothetical protein
MSIDPSRRAKGNEDCRPILSDGIDLLVQRQNVSGLAAKQKVPQYHGIVPFVRPRTNAGGFDMPNPLIENHSDANHGAAILQQLASRLGIGFATQTR